MSSSNIENIQSGPKNTKKFNSIHEEQKNPKAEELDQVEDNLDIQSQKSAFGELIDQIQDLNSRYQQMKNLGQQSSQTGLYMKMILQEIKQFNINESLQNTFQKIKAIEYYNQKIEKFKQSSDKMTNILKQKNAVPINQKIVAIRSLLQNLNNFQNQKGAKFRVTFSQIHEDLQELFLELGHNPNRNEELQEEYKDFDQQMMEEGQIGVNCISFETKTSQTFKDKKEKLKKELQNMLKNHEIAMNPISLNEHIDSFTENILSQGPLVQASNLVSQGTQTIPIPPPAILLDRISDNITLLQSEIQPLVFDEISQNLDNLESIYQDQQIIQKTYQNQADVTGKFLSDTHQLIENKLKTETANIQSQMFSQQMLENVLELAKLEKIKQQQYFNLGQIIFDSFNILNANDINLTAHIDHEKNLQFIQQVFGEKKRIFQILTCFLANSVRYTKIGGQICVGIKILGQQTRFDMTKMQKRQEQLLQKFLTNEDEILKNLRQDFKIQKMHEQFLDVEILIKSSGMGFPLEFIDFNRIDEKNKTIGISICKKIIENMGGSVRFSGNEFILNFKTKCIPKLHHLTAKLFHSIESKPFVFINKEDVFLQGIFSQDPQLGVSNVLDTQQRRIDQLLSQQMPAEMVVQQAQDEIIEESKYQEVFVGSNEQIVQIQQPLEIAKDTKFNALIANDEAFELYKIETILKFNQIKVRKSQNGYEAYQNALEAYEYQKQNLNLIMKNWLNKKFRRECPMFDFVILDLNMPISDGLEAFNNIINLYNAPQIFTQNSVELQLLRPLMIAITPNDKLGNFDLYFKSFNSGQIQDIILQKLIQRDIDLKEKFEKYQTLFAENHEINNIQNLIAIGRLNHIEKKRNKSAPKDDPDYYSFEKKLSISFGAD